MKHPLYQLRMARGTNDKYSVLVRNKDYSGWKKYLEMVYNPYINYYVSAPVDSTFVETDELDIHALIEDLVS